jgi:toxin ParE1/3/4
MIVVISDAAEAELEAIGDWIAEANPTRALSFVMELRRRCEALSDVPRGFPLVPRYEHLGIRRRPHAGSNPNGRRTQTVETSSSHTTGVTS